MTQPELSPRDASVYYDGSQEDFRITDDGDVVPADRGEPIYEDGVSYVGDVEQRQRELLGSRIDWKLQSYSEATRTPAVPTEVMDVLHEHALVAYALHKEGAREERIARKAYAPMVRKLAMLAVRKVDISGAFQGHNGKYDFAADDESERDRKIDHIMNTQGLSYDDAEKKVE